MVTAEGNKVVIAIGSLTLVVSDLSVGSVKIEIVVCKAAAVSQTIDIRGIDPVPVSSFQAALIILVGDIGKGLSLVADAERGPEHQVTCPGQVLLLRIGKRIPQGV